MLVRERYKRDPEIKEISVEDLIYDGTEERHGQIEQLESRIEQLVRIVAFLLERGDFTDEDILKITGHYDCWAPYNAD